MKSSARHVIVLVTAPSLSVARRLALGALRAKQAACANLAPKIESHYWWRGKMETDSEVLIIFKTTSRRLASLEKFILGHHPYDTPEFVVLPLVGGSTAYLKWLTSSVESD